ncbi:Frizzled-4 [Armadillidium nasatum]|uniref:Frizzled-4 n=1 Tax=Armadillidium nasatum TaxID=96803 RepID=A0A5N5SMH1_9CRUS|nr:Frizzled-4 [Armadillidium nasatum]
MVCFLMLVLYSFSFVILFYNAGAEEAEFKRCKPIPFEACKDVGYNYTALPNLVGIELENEAEYSLSTFKPLVKFGCSSQLQFLLCSLYAPMCTPQVPTLIGPCKSLCEGVRDRCSPVLRGFGFPWPAAFNCSSLPPENNERHMCMEGPTETVPLPPTLPPPPTPQHSRMRCSHLAHPQLYVYLNATGRCAPLCGADIMFSNEDKVFAAVWMSIWGVATFFVGLGALATLLLDASLFRYPDRAAVHICFCYALVAAGYLVRLGVGGGSVACRKDPELGISLLITEGALNTPCVAVFLLLYYFSLSAGAWWVIYCGCCLLRVWRNVTHEKFIQRSSVLHALGWGTPSVVTVACLVLRKVEADELTSRIHSFSYPGIQCCVQVFGDPGVMEIKRHLKVTEYLANANVKFFHIKSIESPKSENRYTGEEV